MEAKETKGTLKRTSRNYNDNVKKKKNKTPKNTQKNTQQNTENKRLSYTKTTKKNNLVDLRSLRVVKQILIQMCHQSQCLCKQKTDDMSNWLITFGKKEVTTIGSCLSVSVKHIYYNGQPTSEEVYKINKGEINKERN